MQDALVRAAARLTDDELLCRLRVLAGCERQATAELVAHLAELDARKLHLGQGYGSLFSYCTQALRLAEHAAYNRIEAARASRRFPVILERLKDGSLNLSSLRLLAPHLGPENCASVLAQAAGKSKREIELLVARLAPRADLSPSIRKLPAAVPAKTALPITKPLGRLSPAAAVAAECRALGLEHQAAVVGAISSGPGPTVPGPGPTVPGPGPTVPEGGCRAACGGVGVSSASAPNGGSSVDESGSSREAVRRPGPPAAMPSSRPVISPLSPERYRVQFTVGRETHENLRRAQDLLRREVPDGDPGVIFDRALKLPLEDVARRKLAAAARPRPVRAPLPARSRHVPAHIKRAVWQRDGGQCAFVAASGRRCRERAFLEFHHIEPHGVGGETSFSNLSLRCRAHNVHEHERLFGLLQPDAAWRARRVSEAASGARSGAQAGGEAGS